MRVLVGAVLGVVTALVTVVVTLPAGTAVAAPGPQAGVVRSEVAFVGADGYELHGTVTAPARARGRMPAMVLVHGSGVGRRGSHEAEAASFARDGIVTLTYDKRTVGYEQTGAGYERLAVDALAGLHALRHRPDVDPGRVGLWGLSEGGWVVPLAASRSTDVAFVVLVGASSLPPRRQQEWNDRTDLLHAGVTGSVVAARSEQLAFLGASLPSVPREDYDPLPALRRTHQPVLAVWADQDRVVPPAESARLLRHTLEESGNRRATLRFVPGAEHTMHRSPDGFVELDGLSPDYLRLVSGWVVAGPPAGPSADPEPGQLQQSTPMPPPSWWETLAVQAGVGLALVLLFLSHPVAALARRRRPRPAAAVLSGAGLLTVVGLAVYLDHLIGADADELGPLIAGHPVPWLGLQLLAVVTVAATIVVAVGAVRRRDDRARLVPLLVGGLLFVPLALTWGLLTP